MIINILSFNCTKFGFNCLRLYYCYAIACAVYSFLLAISVAVQSVPNSRKRCVKKSKSFLLSHSVRGVDTWFFCTFFVRLCCVGWSSSCYVD